MIIYIEFYYNYFYANTVLQFIRIFNTYINIKNSDFISLLLNYIKFV